MVMNLGKTVLIKLLTLNIIKCYSEAYENNCKMHFNVTSIKIYSEMAQWKLLILYITYY